MEAAPVRGFPQRKDSPLSILRRCIACLLHQKRQNVLRMRELLPRIPEPIWKSSAIKLRMDRASLLSGEVEQADASVRCKFATTVTANRIAACLSMGIGSMCI